MKISQIVAVLSFVATLLTFVASYLGAIDPSYGIWAMVISGTISAFVRGVTEGFPGPTPPSE